jgi:hypothetical protein
VLTSTEFATHHEGTQSAGTMGVSFRDMGSRQVSHLISLPYPHDLTDSPEHYAKSADPRADRGPNAERYVLSRYICVRLMVKISCIRSRKGKHPQRGRTCQSRHEFCPSRVSYTVL